jgi:hypothetical protein
MVQHSRDEKGQKGERCTGTDRQQPGHLTQPASAQPASASSYDARARARMCARPLWTRCVMPQNRSVLRHPRSDRARVPQNPAAPGWGAEGRPRGGQAQGRAGPGEAAQGRRPRGGSPGEAAQGRRPRGGGPGEAAQGRQPRGGSPGEAAQGEAAQGEAAQGEAAWPPSARRRGSPKRFARAAMGPPSRNCQTKRIPMHVHFPPTHTVASDQKSARREPSKMPEPAPRIADIVHYVSHGSAGGEYGRECRAAIVTEVVDRHEVGLFVANPTGLFLNRNVMYDDDDDPGQRRGGTWHWPEEARG